MGRNHVDVIAKNYSDTCEVSVLCDMITEEHEKAARLAPGGKTLSRREDFLKEDFYAVII